MSETKCGTGTGIVREALLLLFHVADKPAFRICGSASVCFLMLQRWLQGPLGSREAALGRVARFSRMLGVWRFQNSSRARFSWRFTRRRGRFGLDSSARSYAGFPSSRHTNSPFRTFNLHRRGVQVAPRTREFCAYACSRCNIWRLVSRAVQKRQFGWW